MFDFFYGNEAEQYQFYRVPQALFTNEKFICISCEAKLLYGFLLDRCGLSKKNKWCEDDGRLYVFFKQDEACEKLNIGKDKAVKIFNELEKIGLISRKKQGQGKPIKIYVCNFAKEIEEPISQTPAVEQESEVKTSKNPKSEQSDFSENIEAEVKTPENPKSKPLKIRSPYIYSLNQTEISHTNPSIYQGSKTEPMSENDGWTDEERQMYEIYIKENIEYNSLMRKNISPDTLDLIVDIMLEAYNPSIDYIVINGQSINSNVVMRQYEKLDISHIEYVLDSIKDVSRHSKIKNMRMYLKSCLYNAPYSIDLYYQSEVEYNFANDGTDENN